MKIIAIPLLLACIACASCTTTNTQQIDSKVYQIYSYPVVGTKPQQHLVVVFQTSQAYNNLAEFKTFIASLPKGSYVDWDTGCIRFTHLPIGSEKIAIEELKAFATSAGVTFRYSCGW